MDPLKSSAAILLILLIPWSWSRCQHSTAPVTNEVVNLVSFAKLYGYVKYFHPSDEARVIDWDKFAIYGVEAVKEAESRDELKATLGSLFLPIAPTLKISSGEIPNKSFMRTYVESLDQDTSELLTVAWQHLGVDLKGNDRTYSSGRINRDTVWKKQFSIYQMLDDLNIEADQLSFQAAVKAEIGGPANSGLLLLAFLDENSKPTFAEQKIDKSTYPDEWVLYDVQADVEHKLRDLMFTVVFTGAGKLWIDDVKIRVRTNGDNWKQVSIQNPMFEKEISRTTEGWEWNPKGFFTYGVVTGTSYEGQKSFHINSPPRLFDKVPQPGETTTRKLSGDLWCEVPLVLYSNKEHTIPKANEVLFEGLQRRLDTINPDAASANDENVRLANVIIAWNIFQHFYPYFDVIDTNWEEQLSLSLQQALADQTEEDFYVTLSKMLASLHDGHIQVYHPSRTQKRTFPFLVDWVEDKVVVTHSLYEEIKPGDVIQSVDEAPATELVRSEMELISGSPQRTLYRALRKFGLGEADSKAEVKIDRGGVVHTVTVPRSRRQSDDQMFKNNELSPIDKIDNEIFYVDLTRASILSVSERVSEIAAAEGVIFDLRGLAKNNASELISHLLMEPDTSGQWLQTPRIIYPDQKQVEYEKREWYLKPASPRIKGKVIFITNAGAISAAESYLSLVDHYKIGEIVGQRTAGANGNINTVLLPGKYLFGWTGMKVVKHDGSRHHLVGIQPTVPVEKTLTGIREGRDEFLEKAIEVVKQ